MTPPRSFILALCLLGLGAGATVTTFGQGASRVGTPPATDRKKALEEAQKKLREKVDLEKARGTARGLMDKIPDNVGEAARSALSDPAAKAQAIDAAKAAAEALMPEAQKLLKDNRQAAEAAAARLGAMAAPTPGAPVQAVPVPSTAAPAPGVADAPPGPVPQPLPAITDLAALATGGRTPTVVVDADKCDFDREKAVLIYTGHVKARHPDFFISCEQLVVHLEPDQVNGGPGRKTKKKSNPVSASKEDQLEESGVKMAVATGPTVSVEKRGEDGAIQQGRCRRLVYDGATRIITLSENPQVQSGNILQIADDPGTTMTFDRKGKMNTNGRARTILISDQPPEGGATPAAGAGATRN